MSVPVEINVSSKETESGYKVFTFETVEAFRKAGVEENANCNQAKYPTTIIAELLFTRNCQDMEMAADKLFLLFQEDCPMNFQNTNYTQAGNAITDYSESILTRSKRDFTRFKSIYQKAWKMNTPKHLKARYKLYVLLQRQWT